MISNQILNQGDMETWFSQINVPDFYMPKMGVLHLLEPRLKECSYEKKELVLSFEVKDWELNPEGGLHGGIIVTGFDMTFGLLCHYFEKPNMVCTVNLSTTFIQPVLPGDTVEYHAYIISHRKNIISMRGEARLKRENILAATATSTFMILDKQIDLPK
jgi:uncharacterized protein (TIGR00369 family)